MRESPSEFTPSIPNGGWIGSHIRKLHQTHRLGNLLQMASGADQFESTVSDFWPNFSDIAVVATVLENIFRQSRHDQRFPVRFLDEFLTRTNTWMTEIETKLNDGLWSLEAKLEESFRNLQNTLCEETETTNSGPRWACECLDSLRSVERKCRGASGESRAVLSEKIA